MKIVDDAGLEEVAVYFKKHQSNVITKDAKLDILVLQAKLRDDHYLKQRRLSISQNKSSLKESLQFKWHHTQCGKKRPLQRFGLTMTTD